MINILIHGCSGTMGGVVTEMALARPDLNIVAGVDPAAGSKDFPFPVYSELADCVKVVDVDVIIDFSIPEALKTILEATYQLNASLIIATTGYTEDDRARIHKYAERLPVFQVANMSLGINLMSELLPKAAAVLGDGFDIEIIEKHHNLKKDAPSGTAYALADSINQAFMNSKNYVFGRHTRTERRKVEDIGIHAVRGGTIVGEHQVLFAGKDEIFEIRHSASSKQIFATGALQAARFMAGKPHGFYDMKDMIVAQSAVSRVYTSDEDALVSIFDIPDDPRKITEIFRMISERNIILDMISQTAPLANKVNISFTLPRKDVEQMDEVLTSFQEKIPDLKFELLSKITKITVEGPGMEVQSGVAAQMFEIMANQNIKLHTISTSETKISYIIREADRALAVESVKQAFGI